MAEQIKIAELSINTDQLVAEMQQTKRSVDDLTNAQKELKKAGDTSSKTFIQNEQALKQAKATYSAQAKTLGQVTGATKQLDNELKVNVKSLADAAANNKALRQSRENLNLTTVEGQKALVQINSKIDKNTEFMKANQDEQIKNKMNVGAYKDSILEATGASRAYTGGLEVMAAAQAIYSTVVGKSTGATKLFRIALASTGIGLLLIALASLISYFATTQEGIDKVTSVLRPLQSVFQSIWGVVQGLGKSMVDAFSSPKKVLQDLVKFIETNVTNRLKAFSVIMKAIQDGDWEGAFNGVVQLGTGITDATDKVRSMGKATGEFFSDAIKQGQEIDRLTKALKKSEGDYTLEKERLNKVFEQEKKLAEDVNLSTSERLEAVDRALAAQNELKDLTVGRLEQEAELLRLKTLQNDTSDEEKNAIKAKLAEVEKAIAEEAAKTTELQNKKNSITKEGQAIAAAARQKGLDDAITKQQAELDHYIASQGVKAKTLQEELNIAKEVAKQRGEVLDAQYKAGAVSQAEYDTEKLNISNELAQAQMNLAAENAARELQIFKDANATRIAENGILTQALVDQEQARLDKIAEKERQYQQSRLENGIISETEYNAAINTINEENRIAKAGKDTQLKEQETALKAEQLEWDLEQELLGAESKFERQQIQLDRKYEQDIATAERLGKDTTQIEKQYAEQSAQIETAKVNSKLSLASGALGNMISIMGKESDAGKAMAVAQTTIDTYMSATSAFSALSGIAVIGPVLGGIAAAAAVVSGLANVKKILAVPKPKLPAKTSPKKLSRGGVLRGARHYNGGIDLGMNYEGEDGEAVMNRTSTAMFKPLLSAINIAGGGVSFQGSGMTSTAPQSLIDYDLLASKMAQANMSLPTPQVSVSEINTVSQRVSVIENRSIF